MIERPDSAVSSVAVSTLLIIIVSSDVDCETYNIRLAHMCRLSGCRFIIMVKTTLTSYPGNENQ